MKIGVIIALIAGIVTAVYISSMRPERTSVPKEVVTEQKLPIDIPKTSSLIQSTTSVSVATSTMEKNIATITTTKGVITLELFTDKTPTTAGNFITLAESGYYNGVKFHRVIPDFMIQGGDPLTKDDTKSMYWGTGGPGYAIPDEFVQGLSNVRGTISMANSGPNTGGSQFFINVNDNTFLDGKHAVFGKVISGMDVVDAIVNTPRNNRDVPNEPMVMQSVTIGTK